ncbi:MAG: DUF262 domain-containing protein [Lachnospiraceae bacterium]|nr:DUF262 domain-containing protein [Lachnospiraceae bacterium]
MSLEKANISMSAKQLKILTMNGKINLDHIIQRSMVWEGERKSRLIESMILGYPIPPLYAKKMLNDGVYYVMDGKQRISTIKQYLNDEFALSSLPPVAYIDAESNEECTANISRMKFTQLPDSLKDIIKDTMFTMVYFENLTPYEEKELFKRLNAGKPLNTKSKLLASFTDVEEILDIGSHKIFEEMLSTKAKNNKNQATIVMKVWCMLNQEIEDVSFETKAFRKTIENAVVSESEKNEMNNVLDFAYNVHKILADRLEHRIAKKIYTETHFISLVPFFKTAIDNSIKEEAFADWLMSFYSSVEDASVSEEYNKASMSASAKFLNVRIRNKVLTESYKAFFTDNGGDL